MSWVGGDADRIEAAGRGLGQIQSNTQAMGQAIANALRGVAQAVAGNPAASQLSADALTAAGAQQKAVGSLAQDVKYLRQALDVQADQLRKAGGRK
jgi:hypothetical protein